MIAKVVKIFSNNKKNDYFWQIFFLAMSLIVLNQISLSYPDGDGKIGVLQGLSLNMQHGEAVAVTGPSGSGKSTLLSIIGTLLQPDSGEYYFDGELVSNFNDAQFRNRSIGFIFQDHRLLPQFTAKENVLLPTLACRKQSSRQQEERADYLMHSTGIANLSHKYPEHISGGERQRVAICRALIMKPVLLLADEPTGLLDTQNADKITDLLLEVNASEKCALLMVTHSDRVAQKAQRRLYLRDGKLYV